MGRRGFTLIEILVVIVILAILMAIAIPLYLRSVRDSQRQTCRSNMQTIAHAEQSFKITSPGHLYTEDLSQLVGVTRDLQSLPRCPSDSGADPANDYTVTANADGTITVRCASDEAAAAVVHNTVGGDTSHGFTAGLDAE